MERNLGKEWDEIILLCSTSMKPSKCTGSVRVEANVTGNDTANGESNDLIDDGRILFQDRSSHVTSVLLNVSAARVRKVTRTRKWRWDGKEEVSEMGTANNQYCNTIVRYVERDVIGKLWMRRSRISESRTHGKFRM